VGFLMSKLRVVIASNKLYDLAFKISLGKLTYVEAFDELQPLLQNSGESATPVPFAVFRITLRWLLPLYFGTPVVGTIIYFIAMR
jgi:hypothetical protein